MATFSNSLTTLLATGFFLGTISAAGQGATTALPDSPGYLLQAESQAPGTPTAQSASSSSTDSAVPASTAPVSPMYPTSKPYLHRVVKADMGPQPLTAGQKFELGLRSPYSLIGFGTNIVTSAESHLTDSRPHYGTDRAGYGERLGAAELKSINESFFSYGLYAAIFRDDPHYYIMGPGHSFKSRAVYAASRVLLTRKDSGGTGINFPKILGIASAQALTNAYYPQRDRGADKTAIATATNLATSAATLELNEFLPDVLKSVRHKKH